MSERSEYVPQHRNNSWNGLTSTSKPSGQTYKAQRPFSALAASVSIYPEANCSTQAAGIEEESSCSIAQVSALTLLTGTDRPSCERPVSELMNILIESAQYKHATRKLKHPRTYNYSIFEWQTQEAHEASKYRISNRPSSSGSSDACSHRGSSSSGCSSLSNISEFKEVVGSSRNPALGASAPSARVSMSSLGSYIGSQNGTVTSSGPKLEVGRP